MILHKTNLLIVAGILKKKFTSLTVVETIDLATEIIEALQPPPERD